MVAGGLLLLFVLPATLACGYYAFGAILGRFPRSVAARVPSHRIAILIPAHDEETTLPKALASIADVEYPAELVDVWVVVDHCVDNTERIARDFGAKCLVRIDSDKLGKGYALEFGLSALLTTKPDAVLILDADCRISGGLLSHCDAELGGGAKVVQYSVVSQCDPKSPVSVVAAVGAALDNRMATAADSFGLFVPLRGTGMLFARAILERHPWTMAGLAEDAEYAAELRRHGVRIRFAAQETVTSEAPPREDAFLGQRRRWRASLRVPSTGRWFTSKPVILVHLVLTFVASLITEQLWLMTWAMGLVTITMAIYVEVMLWIGVRWPGFRSFWLVGRLAVVALGGFWTRETRWQRTPR